jgi:two-component system cell cycle sensor histidine kinase/response regulator CckA
MAGYSLLSSRKTIAAASFLLLAHAVVLAAFGTRAPGPLLSDLVQLAVGILCAGTSFQASRRSNGLGRYFWGLVALSFFLWVLAQTLTTYDEAFHAPTSIEWLVNILFFFWFTPLGMAVFLDPDSEPKGFDLLLILDVAQAVVFAVAAYLYFFYIPSRSETGTELAHSVWGPYFMYAGCVTGAFLLRSVTTESAAVRALFGRMGLYFLASSLADYFYFYGPGKDLPTGAWFDIVWTLTLMMPFAFAATWDGTASSRSVAAAPVQAKNAVVTQLFPLLFPLFVLVMSARIAQERVALASIVVLVSFACSSARLLMTQHRQQRSTDALRQSHGLLEAVIEGTTDAIFVKDVNGRYLMINSAGAGLLGSSAAEVVGKNDTELFSLETGQRIMERDRLVIQSGSTQTYEDIGTAAGVTRTYLSTKGPYRDANGRITGLVGISRDITERKRMEESLQVQKAFLEELIECAPEAIAIVDLNNIVQRINREFARLFGYTPDETRGRNLDDLIVSVDERDEAAWLGREAARGGTASLETTRRRKDGSRVDVSVLVSPISVETGHIAVYCIYRDITGQRQIEQQLRQAQKMEALGKLAGGVAHDFNNLLTVINGYCRMLLEQHVHAEGRSGYLERIEEAADKAAALTRQLLAFSRRQVLEPRAINLNAVVRDLEKMLRRLIGEDVETLTQVAPDLGTVRADPGQIEQVIMNLVVNARDAMPHGGKLTLETANVELDENYAQEHVGVRAGRYVMLAVTDNGTGMDSETMARLFEPFFTTKELGKGTGLGLSTVHGIVRQSDGHVWVYSEPGRGTTFKVYLPRVDAPPEPLAADKRSPQGVRGNETVLLIEDDRAVRELVNAVLSGCGYSVLVPDHVSEAERLCQAHSGIIHLLLTDVVMPGINGKDLARLVTQHHPEIRVLYMSGYTNNAIVHHGVLDPGAFFLQKPFSPAGLANKVREVLDQRATLQ